MNVEERRRLVGIRQCLAPGSKLDDVAEIARAVVGLHASDPATVFLSVRARMTKPTIAAVEEALYERRTVARVLGMRRTMFVVPVDMVPVVHHGAAAAFVAREEARLAGYVEKEGIATDGLSWVRRVKEATLAALEARGSAVATELAEDVPELNEKLTFGKGKTWGGQVGVSTRILFLMATDGSIIRGRPRGTWLSSQYRWAMRDEWLGDSPAGWDTEAAEVELLRGWLATYGPGTLTDMRWWTGWTKSTTMRTIDRLPLETTGAGSETLFRLAPDPAPAPDGPWAALLPALDPAPMGWKERDWYLGPRSADLFDRNGNIGPTIWVDGRVVGGWAIRPDGSVVTGYLEDVSSGQHDLIEADVAAVVTFLEGTVVTPRFRTPLEKRLLAEVAGAT